MFGVPRRNRLGTKLALQDVNCLYGDVTAVEGVSMEIPDREVVAFMGPSGCGKSTLIRCLNRMNDTIDGFRLTGSVTMDGQDLYGGAVDLISLRRRVGMVFQAPAVFPFSVRENVIYGPKRAGIKDRALLHAVLVSALKRAALWDEVKDRLDEPADSLSGGQQQRMCIARALAMQPEVLLMDEPCSALDPIATAKVEDVIRDLRQDNTVVIVTHNLQQAGRVSDRTAFMFQGKLVEYGQTDRVFKAPQEALTQQYLSGRIG
jgi:phosphate transport system ATP-binding protein